MSSSADYPARSGGAPSLRIIQPITWAGQRKGGPDTPMVCGACPDWQACADADRCARARDEDYARAMGSMGGA